MRQDDTLVNTLTAKNSRINGYSYDEIGDDHLSTSLETPMKANAFEMDDVEKKYRISGLFAEIMDVLGLDLSDDSLQGSPDRVAKMYVEEIFSGLNPKNKPKMEILNTQDVAVIIDARHLCVSSRGVEDNSSSTITAFYGGKFNSPEKISELQNFINHGI